MNTWWVDQAWPDLFDWMKSAGFGGAIAAVIAGAALGISIRKNRHETWWEQVEWTLTAFTNDPDPDSESYRLASRGISFLVTSPLATRAETRFLMALTDTEIHSPGSFTETKRLVLPVDPRPAIRDTEPERDDKETS